jgi:hypothetical protein
MRAVGARVWGWLEDNPQRALLCFFGLVLVLRLPFLAMPLESDEGGFLMVAAQWHGPGNALYTDQWVDRPPLLLLVFKLAVFLGAHAYVLRLMAVGFALITVTAAWFAGRTINGSRGAVAGGLAAAAVGSMFAIDGFALTGECIASAFVLTSCALILSAKYDKVSQRAGFALALGAGIAAALAFLTKQNFIDAGIFAAALLLAKPHKTWRLMVAYAAGLALPLLATAGWVVSPDGPGLYRMWVALFRFRQRSLNVMEEASLSAPLERLKWLGVLFIVTGLFLLVWQLLVAVRRVKGRRSLRIGLVFMLAYVAISIAAGASWWTHYLLQLTAVLSMGAALATRRKSTRVRTHYGVMIVTATSVISMVVGTVVLVQGNSKGQGGQDVAEFLREASLPGDSVVLAYGAPNIIQESGLTTPYRYSWSLPLRTRDPKLKTLVEVLSGPDAPTWLVEIGDFDWWGLDNTAFQQVRADDYHVAATVCGHAVYLHDGLTRTLPADLTC